MHIEYLLHFQFPPVSLKTLYFLITQEYDMKLLFF